MSKRGLPVQASMRHDSHFVEALNGRFGESVGKFIAISQIEPNPNQPRENVGDIDELQASIESHGVLEPILVRPIEGGRFQIISGERRYRAATKAGLAELPCIEIEAGENDVLEIALIENLHRKDLTPFEEAQGYHSLMEKYGYTHQRISETVGKSRVAITEALAILGIPEEIREECRRADIGSKRILLEIAKADGPAEMRRVLAAALRGSSRSEIRQQRGSAAQGAGAKKPFRFTYAPKDSPFRLSLAFRKARVSREELIGALRGILERLEAGEISDKPRKQ